MTKPVFPPDSAILRAKPLFELSDVANKSNRCRVKKTPAKLVLPPPVERSVPFDSETILETVECPPSGHVGSSSSQVGLRNLSLELADCEDLFNDSTLVLADGDGSRHSRRKSIDAADPGSLSAASSEASIVLAPLKAPPQVLMCVVAKDWSQQPDCILELEHHRRREEEELARIYKREKESEAQRAHGLKIVRPYTAPKKARVCDLPFTSELLLQHNDD
ncbi:hypothetical protein ON010_g6818 [Phytophthora cinnamomi]|nr:hypothetical protein ON010_g6818 [Phytophthora cinnamomi]